MRREPLRAFTVAFAALMVLASVVEAQAPKTSPTPPVTGDDTLSNEEQLEQMLAPLALYPDDLLAQILMACTYPIEIAQADRWAKAHKDAQGDEAARLLEQQPWDASVKSLVAVPDVLAMLSERLEWAQHLGDAWLGQPGDVMAAAQSLRTKAQGAGGLESGKNQTVRAEAGTIEIASAQPDVIWVPVHDSTRVYGEWPWAYYPPYTYYPSGWHLNVGVGVAAGFAWGYAWGHADWLGGDIDIDVDRNVERNRSIDRDAAKASLGGGKGTWKHDPAHRHGLPYRDGSTAARFDGLTSREATEARRVARGHPAPPVAAADEPDGGALASPAPAGARSAAPPPSRPTTAVGWYDPRGLRNGIFDGSRRDARLEQRAAARGRYSRGHGRR